MSDVKNIIYALGVGHNTPVFIDLAEACGYKVIGLYHYNSERIGEQDHGFDILGSFEDLYEKEDLAGLNFLLTMGDNTIRTEVCKKLCSLGGNVPTLVHPTAIVSRFASISSIGVYIGPFTYIQGGTIIDENTVVLSGVNISHSNKIGKSCFIAGGVTIGAYTIVEDFVFMGQGTLSISGKVNLIGTHAYIGAGSLVTRDVAPFTVSAGSPAKEIKNGALIDGVSC